MTRLDLIALKFARRWRPFPPGYVEWLIDWMAEREVQLPGPGR